jgi:gamma-glutamylcyclotransferase (GGCT)/AIG2-like uncharacterized protein YtfP
MPSPRQAKDPSRSSHRETWRSPAGISAIAAAVTCVLGVITFFVVDLARPDDTPGPTPDGNLVFVYGTSMPNHSRYSYIEHYVESHRPAQVDGLLYDSGAGYPAARFGPGDPIPGYLLTLRPDSVAEFFTQMTQIEAGLFRQVGVTTRDGTRAQAFEWIGPTDGFKRIQRWEGD